MNKYFPISELKSRYQIGKQAEINRRKYLNIKPVKIDGSYYITNEELKLLDLLDEFLKSPASKMADFSPPGEISLVDEQGLVNESVFVDTSYVEFAQDNVKFEQLNIPGLLDVLESSIRKTVVETVKELETVRFNSNPINHWEKLLLASKEGLLLTTSEIKALLGTKPRLRKGESCWQRGSFIFTKAGFIGGMSAWRVILDRKEFK